MAKKPTKSTPPDVPTKGATKPPKTEAGGPAIKGPHPASLVFPEYTPDEYQRLKADIEANGLRQPIGVTPQGEVVDGRHRLKACKELGVTPAFTEVTGDPWAYAMSENGVRRDLTTSQRAWVAALIAKEPGQQGEDLRTRVSAVANRMGVSTRSVQSGLNVARKGSAELHDIVGRGQVRVSVAEKVARLEASQQTAWLAADAQTRKAMLKNPSTPPETPKSNGESWFFDAVLKELGGHAQASRELAEEHAKAGPQSVLVLSVARHEVDDWIRNHHVPWVLVDCMPGKDNLVLRYQHGGVDTPAKAGQPWDGVLKKLGHWLYEAGFDKEQRRPLTSTTPEFSPRPPPEG